MAAPWQASALRIACNSPIRSIARTVVKGSYNSTRVYSVRKERRWGLQPEGGSESRRCSSSRIWIWKGCRWLGQGSPSICATKNCRRDTTESGAYSTHSSLINDQCQLEGRRGDADLKFNVGRGAWGVCMGWDGIGNMRRLDKLIGVGWRGEPLDYGGVIGASSQTPRSVKVLRCEVESTASCIIIELVTELHQRSPVHSRVFLGLSSQRRH